ncbi:MAG: FIST N-terminal domain-containing protein [Actinomycetes bacterium]
MKVELHRSQGEAITQAPDWDRIPDPSMDGPNTLVMVLGDTALLEHPLVFAEYVAAFPTSVIIGCSTAGQILDDSISDDAVTLMVAAFEHTRLAKASAELPNADASFEVGTALAESLNADDLTAVLLLSCGVGVNGSELVRGLSGGLHESVVITGGLAGDGTRFARTWVVPDRAPRESYVTAVGFYGDRLQVGYGSSGGWVIFGPERRVTRSRGNVLFELDGEPALALYKQYLGELAGGLPATGMRFPLALTEFSGSSRELVRTVLTIDEQEQSMTFAGDIPQGWLAKLMRASSNELIDGAEEAARLARDRGQSSGAVLSIAISCVGRRMVLGENTEEELEVTLEKLPIGTRQVGFYSYGEISSNGVGMCDLHNQTMTLTTLFEQ